MPIILRGIASCLVILLVLRTGEAVELKRLTIGGKGGLRWTDADSATTVLDFTTVPGAMQPQRFKRGENILPLLQSWNARRTPIELDFIPGLHPRVWNGTTGLGYVGKVESGPLRFVDGDPTTFQGLDAQVPVPEMFTIDTGVPVPAHRFVFYPPQEGIDPVTGDPLKENFFDSYEVSINPVEEPFLKDEGIYHIFRNIIASVPQNFQSVVSIDFPQRYVRFVRLRVTPPTGPQPRGLIAETELYGEGFPAKAIYLSKILDLGAEVTFHRLTWAASTWRDERDGAIPTGRTDVAVALEIRAGKDNDPDVYHGMTDTGEEDEVSREDYEKNLKPRAGPTEPYKVGQRGSITYDTENWGFWSYPIREPGYRAPIPQGRFVQFRLILSTEDFFDCVRIDSLSLEYFPLFARQIVGEVAILGQPIPPRGGAEVRAGRPTVFTYDLHALFDAAEQEGFDGVRVVVPSTASLHRLEIGEPLMEVTPRQVETTPTGLSVVLPRKVTRSQNDPVRLTFETTVYLYANEFSGEVFNSGQPDLVQQITPGDANASVSTNTLRVIGTMEQILSDVRVAPNPVTPNGDSINDTASIIYTLFRLTTDVEIEVIITTLEGAVLRRIPSGPAGSGHHRVVWNGKDEEGRLVAPGLYLCVVSVITESETIREVQTVGVIY